MSLSKLQTFEEPQVKQKKRGWGRASSKRQDALTVFLMEHKPNLRIFLLQDPHISLNGFLVGVLLPAIYMGHVINYSEVTEPVVYYIRNVIEHNRSIRVSPLLFYIVPISAGIIIIITITFNIY